jgi:hypothetical protein
VGAKQAIAKLIEQAALGARGAADDSTKAQYDQAMTQNPNINRSGQLK